MISTIIAIIKGNPMLAAGVGVYGLSMATFLFRHIPYKIGEIMKRQFTTTLSIASQNSSFHNALKAIEKEIDGKNYRTIKISNGRWGSSSTQKGIGSGAHIIRYKKKFIAIERIKEATDTEYDKEILRITKIGRSHKFFDEFIADIGKSKIYNGSIPLYSFDGGWCYAKLQDERSMDTIMIPKFDKELLINRIEDFRESEKWYVENGIPYQLGILLYGPPGTGKTSLIKAIASYLKYPIYYLPANMLSKIESATSELPNNVLFVVEDIDSSFAVKKRTSVEKSKDDSEFAEDMMAGIGLSEILNSLDGMFSSKGRIFITTTNHIKNIDPAIIRPGRIDMKLEIGYVSNETFSMFFNKFYSDSKIDITELDVIDKLSPAMVQELILEKISDIEFVKKCTV